MHDDEVVNSPQLHLLHELTKFVPALEPDLWVKACLSTGNDDKAHFAKPSMVAKILSKGGVSARLGAVRFGAQRSSKLAEEARHRVLAIPEIQDQTEWTQFSPAIVLLAAIDSTAGVLALAGAYNLLADFKTVAKPGDFPTIKDFGKRLSRLIDPEQVSTTASRVNAALGVIEFIKSREKNIGSDESHELIRLQRVNLTALLAFKDSGEEIGAEMADLMGILDFSNETPVIDQPEAGINVEPSAEEIAIAAERAAQLALADRLRLEKFEKLTALDTDIENLSAKVAEFQSPWTLTQQSIKKLGLSSAARGEIVHGFHDKKGDIIIPGRTKQDALELVGVLEWLSNIARQDTATFDSAKILKTTLAAHQSLLVEAAELPARIVEFETDQVIRLRERVPQIIDITGLITEIKANWPVYAVFVADHWPNGSEKSLAIEQLFFN
jgi:hypothetical protein